MNDLLNFDNMLTPKIITVIYFLSLVAVILAGLFTIFAGQGGFLMNLIMGLLTIIFGGLLVRVYCELMIVAFKINENIKRIADKG